MWLEAQSTGKTQRYVMCLLQRLLESTFRLDLDAAREYCEADDRWARATGLLAANDGAGWSLLQVRSHGCRI